MRSLSAPQVTKKTNEAFAAHDAFKHDQRCWAGERHSNNQREEPQIRGCVQVASMVPVYQNLSQLHREALRRNRPQDVSEVLAPTAASAGSMISPNA